MVYAKLLDAEHLSIMCNFCVYTPLKFIKKIFAANFLRPVFLDFWSASHGVFPKQNSITPRSILPKFYCSPITFSPIPCSLIARSVTLTPQSLFPPDHSLPNRSLAPNHPVPSLLLSNFLPDRLIALPLIFEK